MSDPRSDAPRGTGLIGRLNEGFGALAGWSFDNRYVVVGLALALLAGSLALAARVQIDSSYEAYFDPNDPTFLYYDDYLDEFGSDEVSYILYSAPHAEHGPWNYAVMQRIAELTTVLENEVPFIYEVKSLANAELMIGERDSIDIIELSDSFPESQAELLALRARYLAKPMLVGGLLSADAQYAAIIIEMDRTSTDPLEEIRLDPEGGDGLGNLYPQVTDTAISEILARPEYADLVFHHSGDVPMNAAYNVILTDEGAQLDMLTAVVIAIVLALFFRSFVGTLAPVLVVQLSVLTTVAFVVALGWELDMSFSGTPTLLTAIGVAHAVHILSEFRTRFVELGDRRAALVETLELVGTPCLLTSVTTAVGFGSMSFSPIKSLAHMGVYSAFGVLAAFVLSLTLLLAFLSFGRTTPKASSADPSGMGQGGRAMGALLGATAEFVIRRRHAIIVAFAGLLLFSIVGIAQIKVGFELAQRFLGSDAAQGRDPRHRRSDGWHGEPHPAVRQRRSGGGEEPRSAGGDRARAGMGERAGAGAQVVLARRHPRRPQPDVPRGRPRLASRSGEP